MHHWVYHIFGQFYSVIVCDVSWWCPSVFQSFLRYQNVRRVTCSPCSCRRLLHMAMSFTPPWARTSCWRPRHRLNTPGSHHCLTVPLTQPKKHPWVSNYFSFLPEAFTTSRSAAPTTWPKCSVTRRTERLKWLWAGLLSRETCTDLSRSASLQRRMKRERFYEQLSVLNNPVYGCKKPRSIHFRDLGIFLSL